MKNGVIFSFSSSFSTLNIEDFFFPGGEVSVPWEEQFCLQGLSIPPGYFFIAAQLFQSWWLLKAERGESEERRQGTNCFSYWRQEQYFLILTFIDSYNSLKGNASGDNIFLTGVGPRNL